MNKKSIARNLDLDAATALDNYQRHNARYIGIYGVRKIRDACLNKGKSLCAEVCDHHILILTALKEEKR